MKSHEKLGITFAEFGALLGTKALLEQHALKYQGYNANARDGLRYVEAVPHTHAFNMNIGCTAKECGTVSCIGGTMALIMGHGEVAAVNYVDHYHSNSLSLLFFPNEDVPSNQLVNYNAITPQQAVIAIDNFLKTGKPKWRKILTAAQIATKIG